jgi:hypothetical protein
VRREKPLDFSRVQLPPANWFAPPDSVRRASGFVTNPDSTISRFPFAGLANKQKAQSSDNDK